MTESGTGRDRSGGLANGLVVALPGWVSDFRSDHVTGADHRPDWSTAERRMAYVLALAERHVGEQTGGPFAAAVFELGSAGEADLVSVGLNVVVPTHTSIAHAETVAIGLAQQRLGTHDLSQLRDRSAAEDPSAEGSTVEGPSAGTGSFELVSSSEMCAMCLGATVWSGVSAVLWSATTEDVESIAGFDEGPRPADPIAELAGRGITATAGVLRDRGRVVLESYIAGGGEVYNPCHAIGPSDS